MPEVNRSKNVRMTASSTSMVKKPSMRRRCRTMSGARFFMGSSHFPSCCRVVPDRMVEGCVRVGPDDFVIGPEAHGSDLRSVEAPHGDETDQDGAGHRYQERHHCCCRGVVARCDVT